MNSIILLLTACINPGKMPYTHLIDKSERLRQYKTAIDFYLRKTEFPIVFAENSNTDISIDYQNEISKGRIELLTFDGNDNKQRGKGYGEANILEYALNHSQLISKNSYIVKITGRLIVENINIILRNPFPFQKSNSICCSFHSDLNFSDSRFFCAPVEFFTFFIMHKEQINDNQDIFFEHILANCVIKSEIPCYPFWKEPSIIGTSGSTGEKYNGNNTSAYHQKQYRLYILKQILSLTKQSHKYSIIHIILYRCMYATLKIWDNFGAKLINV